MRYPKKNSAQYKIKDGKIVMSDPFKKVLQPKKRLFKARLVKRGEK